MDSSAQKSSRRWRIPRAEMATAAVLIPGEDWHPLDGIPAPEYIPENWDGPHVSVRLVEAFKTLSNLPSGERGNSGGFWPDYWPDFVDQLSQEESDKQLKEERAAAQNRALVRPSAQEVSRMEQAICWPGRYVLETGIARLVQRVTLARSRDLDMQYVLHRYYRNQKPRIDPRQLRNRNRIGLDEIASGLRRDHVRVF